MTSRPRLRTSPAGRLTLSRRSAAATSAAVRPSADSRAASRSTWISRLKPPRMLIAATPSTRSRRYLSFSSASWRSRQDSISPDRLSIITGKEERSNLNTTGGSASSGRLWRMRSTAARTSLSAVSSETPQAKRSCTRERPSAE